MKARHEISLGVIQTDTSKEEILISGTVEKTINACVRATLLHEKINFICSVNINLCDDAYIKQLNRQFRHKDAVTDVLSFPMLEIENPQEFSPEFNDIDPNTGCVILGDMVISFPRAKEQAEEYCHSLEREIGFLTVHSMLHLLGYDHETCEQDENIMFALQKEILNEIGLIG